MATTDASSQVKDTGDGFKYNGVASKGRGKLRQKEPSTRADSGAHVQLQRGAPRDDPQALVSELRDSIERKKTELLADGKHGDHIQSCLSSYFSSLRWDHSRKQPSSSRLPTRMYALGIGEISQSRSAQAQVALLLEMADHIARIAEEEQKSKLPSGTSGQGSSSASSQNGKVDSEKSFQPSLRPALMAFDPIFSDIDRAVLTSLGVTPLTREEASAQACYEATFPPSSGGSATTAFQEEYSLMYMPHCPRPLSERYLRAFWSREALLKHRVSFCWNRVGRYAEFLTDEKLNRESPCLYRISKCPEHSHCGSYTSISGGTAYTAFFFSISCSPTPQDSPVALAVPAICRGTQRSGL
ncbi:hypothetical protein BCV69DRAFT_163216 [Microstroma glucosiphilum]|uniref:SRR1-like domain-containing protein n=1 Tax=Pseudomicrostroma glucosiphilum TaxID=1684307 RepID=A0A316UA57_9BASI|nr:hypothetical protein BCV69DRAFT_163216 [Pseudomicrostroma glucosiphilum]PWN22052.1 hypothetical protein BCV69DRAFT_163216 [Pseudomicrostroma glucosiphilum]